MSDLWRGGTKEVTSARCHRVLFQCRIRRCDPLLVAGAAFSFFHPMERGGRVDIATPTDLRGYIKRYEEISSLTLPTINLLKSILGIPHKVRSKRCGNRLASIWKLWISFMWFGETFGVFDCYVLIVGGSVNPLGSLGY
ncbi:hypothetical protein TNIN_481511 [Trichonephila inaurata madagascariensis]|uniref:Uncharacterized protein n=1 Tax=Trichonephila inaurata madagascariensis TaxID=2747483 RepID=A0A8X7BPN3_9ARAC|nr:hypothetical protein TNIN_481511 [Trichonephila inaurata madagascariensis]